MLLFFLFIAIFGLVAGSFLGMLTYRLPRRLSLAGRSICPHCKNVILWRDNIPLISFFLLFGRCRSCGKKISFRYPIIEFVTLTSFITTAYFWSTQSSDLFHLFLLLLLLLFFLSLSIIDIEHQILPDLLLVLLLFFVILLVLGLPSPTLFINLFVGICAYSFFLFLFLVTKGRGIGFGDVKLAFILGTLLGFPGVIVWLYLSFLIGAAAGLILLLLGYAKLGKPIPFGPFLLFSAWVALLFGEKLWQLSYALIFHY
jgi:prepilin signal peptidase PulO-like enzyme (type II secretory pathway)